MCVSLQHDRPECGRAASQVQVTAKVGQGVGPSLGVVAKLLFPDICRAPIPGHTHAHRHMHKNSEPPSRHKDIQNGTHACAKCIIAFLYTLTSVPAHLYIMHRCKRATAYI